MAATVEHQQQQTQQLARARALVGKRVLWAHQAHDMFAKNMLVECSTPGGMVCLEGWSGEFSPDLFVVV